MQIKETLDGLNKYYESNKRIADNKGTVSNRGNQPKVCDCPNGCKDKGEVVISLESNNHEQGCWVLDKLRHAKYETIYIVDANRSFTDGFTLGSTRKSLGELSE